MRLLSFLRFFLVSTLLLLGCANSHAQGQALGRLFSTPSERVSLDRLRQQNKLGETAPEVAPAVLSPVPQIQQFTHNGFVKRSNGLETTWINQVPNHEQKISSHLKVTQQYSKAPAVSVLLPSGKRQELKVGQSFDAATGKVREVYELPAVPNLPPPKQAGIKP